VISRNLKLGEGCASTQSQWAPNHAFGVMTDATPEPMHDTTPVFRRASRDDVPAIVRMLADDALGAKRETLARTASPATR